MDDPLTVLGLPANSDAEAIRQRYLELVRQNPPDRDAQRFTEIRAAYDTLNDRTARLTRQLFAVSTDRTLDDVLVELQSRQRGERFPTELLLSLGRD